MGNMLSKYGLMVVGAVPNLVTLYPPTSRAIGKRLPGVVVLFYVRKKIHFFSPIDSIFSIMFINLITFE